MYEVREGGLARGRLCFGGEMYCYQGGGKQGIAYICCEKHSSGFVPEPAKYEARGM